MNDTNKVLEINGRTLTPAQVVGVALYHDVVKINPDVFERLHSQREALQDKIDNKEKMYGVNTGCGIRKNIVLPPDELSDYQMHYIPAHCCGFGEPFPVPIVRAAMLVRLNNFLRGNSALRPIISERLSDYLNRGITPVVPRYGSVGASGDLVPLAHVTSAMIEDPNARVIYQEKEMDASSAHRLCGLKKITLEAKEAMGMTNGVNFMAGIGCVVVHEVQLLIDEACLATALSLEAIRGETAAFDPRIHKARPFFGQIYVASLIMKMLAGSGRTTEKARAHTWDDKDLNLSEDPKMGPSGDPEIEDEIRLLRIQDCYSFRCAPQIMSVAVTAQRHLSELLEIEINSATDNPLMFENDEGGYDVLSGGNFHGQPLAQPFGYMASSLAALAGVSDRRFFALLMKSMSYGLPDDLAGPGHGNTGLMIGQYSTAGMLSKIQTLTHPASAYSTPTSANQEDWVSMGITQGLMLLEMLPLVRAILAYEMLAAVRGICLNSPVMPLEDWPLGPGTSQAFNEISQVYANELTNGDPKTWFADRHIAADHLQVVELLKNGLIKRVRAEI